MVQSERYILEQPASRSGAVLSFAVFLPAACSVFVPIGLAATDAGAVLQAAQDHPLATLQVVVGLGLWTLLFVLPVARRLQSFGLSRAVTVADGLVIEEVRTLFGASRIERPLSAFAGIVHRVRTSIDGATQELALIEQGSGREVVFMQAQRISRETIEQVMRNLNLTEISAADLVRLPAMGDVIRFGAMSRPATA